MNLEETPYDCFKTRCVITGTDEEIEKARKDYLLKYPYMQYGTRILKKIDSGIVLQRFRTKKICLAACVHTPRPDPISSDTEEGKDHTIFQTY